MKSEKETNYVTYHHNWYDHSDSRHPRIRTCSVHSYNNYFDGNAKYGIGVTMGASAFAENNYFRNCKNPMMSSGQGTDALGEGTFSGETGGIIKACGNYIEGASSYIPYSQDSTSFDAYEVSSPTEKFRTASRPFPAAQAITTSIPIPASCTATRLTTQRMCRRSSQPRQVVSRAATSSGSSTIPWTMPAMQSTSR